MDGWARRSEGVSVYVRGDGCVGAEGLRKDIRHRAEDLDCFYGIYPIPRPSVPQCLMNTLNKRADTQSEADRKQSTSNTSVNWSTFPIIFQLIWLCFLKATSQKDQEDDIFHSFIGIWVHPPLPPPPPPSFSPQSSAELLRSFPSNKFDYQGRPAMLFPQGQKWKQRHKRVIKCHTSKHQGLSVSFQNCPATQNTDNKTAARWLVIHPWRWLHSTTEVQSERTLKPLKTS